MNRLERVPVPLDASTQMNFIGSVLRRNPQALDALSDRNRHILLSHSDPKLFSSIGELGSIFGVTRQRIDQIYLDSMKRVWKTSAQDLQTAFPLNRLLEAHAMPPERKSEIAREIQSRPEVKTKQSNSARRLWQNPDFRTRVGKALSQRQKARWTDPIYRAHILETLSHPSPETRAKKSEAQRTRFQNPAERERIREARKREWQDPIMRQKRLDAYRKPENRKKISDAAKAREAKKRNTNN